MKKLYGIIDIGSNSIRLMLSDGEVSIKKYLNTTKLADGLDKTGYLQDSAIQRSLNAIKDFVVLAEEKGAEVHIFFFFSVRSAKNGRFFTDSIKDITGYCVDVVCGDMEAKLGFTGASEGQNTCVVDIGGASTEIVCGNNGNIIYSKSVPMGAVRLRDNCGEDQEILIKYIDGKLKEYGSIPKMEKLVAIGGTASTIVAILLQLEVYDSNKVHNYKLYKQDINEIYHKVKSTKLEDRDNIKGLIKGRQDIIVGASLELIKIMEMLGFEYLYVSEKDNLEGYLMLNKDKW